MCGTAVEAHGQLKCACNAASAQLLTLSNGAAMRVSVDPQDA